MTLLRPLLIAVTLMAAFLYAMTGHIAEAWFIAFVGLAAATPWSAYRPGHFATNVISDDLKLTKVLEFAIVGLKAALAPLRSFSTCWSRDPITPGNDSDSSITVPVYDFGDGSDVQTRTPGTAYSSLVGDTSTSSRKLAINTEKVVGISFTNEEAQNQVSFDPEMHGLIKGHGLALKVLQDIFGIGRYGYYPNATLAPMAASAFDVNDVADLAQKGMEAYWPKLPAPGLVLNPAFYFNLAKQAGIIDASQSGSDKALREGVINQIMGFNTSGSAGLPSNNGTGQTFTAATTDICTAAAHGYLTGDQVQVSSATTLPAGLSAATYYYVIKLTDNTFKLASSLANALAGTAVDITDTGTGVHTITLKTNLVGVAGSPSGIITGFRPVIPTAGIRQKLVNFELVDDPETGLTLEYRHIADEDKGKEYQVIGCHYGKQYGLAAALKLLSSPAA